MNTNLLQKLVSESRMTKSEIADIAGISRTTLENALAGADIKISTIEALSWVLGVKCSQFYDESTPDECLEQKKEQGNEQNSGDENNVPTIPKNRSRTTKTPYEALQDKVNNLENLYGERERLIQEKVSYLEALLTEKERLIQILMERDKKD